MGYLTLRNNTSVEIPNGCKWHWDSPKGILRLEGPNSSSLIELVLIDCDIRKSASLEDKYKWSHDWLVDYLREVTGPPYSSNLAKVDNVTWVGWQAVTTLENNMFQGTRCIISIKTTTAARLSFSLKRDKLLVTEIIKIVESVSFDEHEATNGPLSVAV